MAILNSLSINGSASVTGAVNLGVSGEIVAGDYRAVDGDTLAKFGTPPPYKEILYTATGYNTATLPIPVDGLVKNTRTIVIRILPYNWNNENCYMYLPRYIQLYDPDNWLNSNINASHPLKILVVQMYNVRTVDTSTNRFNDISPMMYFNDSSKPYEVHVATTSSELTQSTAKWSCTSGSTSSSSTIMAVFTITNSSNVMSLSKYSTLSSIITNNLVNYL